MIIYNVFANNGGMMRVTESMKDLFSYLPENFPLRVVVFSPRPFDAMDRDKFLWIKWDDNVLTNYSVESIDQIRNYLGKEFSGKKIDLVIGDAHTLVYWEKFDVPFCYDVHFLDRVFYAAFNSDPGVRLLDQLSPHKYARFLNVSEIFSLKREAKYMRRSIAFIANSFSSERHLREYYELFAQDRPIRIVPVTTDLMHGKSSNLENRSVLYRGRFHPQKGLHFIFNRKKNEIPIHMRGFGEDYFYPESLKDLNQKNIHFMPWSNNRETLRQELLQHPFSIFPSIYESWGLSLQESLASGRICIANSCDSGHEEQIRHGENGFLIDMKKSGWEEKLEDIINLPREKLIKISQEASVATTTHDLRLKKFAEVLEEFEAI